MISTSLEDTVSIQKPLLSVSTNNEQSENEIKITIPFIIASKKIKIIKRSSNIILWKLEITVERNEKKNLNKWKSSLCSWNKRQFVTITVLSKFIYKFNWIPSKSQLLFFFAGIDKLIHKLIWKWKGPKDQNTLEKEQSWGTRISQSLNFLQSYSSWDSAYN